VWFDDSDAEAKIVAFLDAHEQEEQQQESAQDGNDDEGVESSNNNNKGLGRRLDRRTASVLDLGCGNGSLLFALHDDGWTGRLVGVDYSERSVELARAVGRERRRRRRLGLGSDDDEEEKEEQEQGKKPETETGEDDDDDEKENVSFQVFDILHSPASLLSPDPSFPGWDLVLDKGTFDAISLSPEIDPATGRRAFEGYGARVLALRRTGGLLVVTSCNWTEEELKVWFDGCSSSAEGGGGGAAKLKLAGRIEYPSFSFGGVKGQTISTLCFEKVGGD
jgi:SAM-dependent methyltransferase